MPQSVALHKTILAHGRVGGHHLEALCYRDGVVQYAAGVGQSLEPVVRQAVADVFGKTGANKQYPVVVAYANWLFFNRYGRSELHANVNLWLHLRRTTLSVAFFRWL